MDSDVLIANNELKKIARKKRKQNPLMGQQTGRIASDKSPFLGFKQVLELVPVSRCMLYMMIHQGAFPRPKALGVRAVAWSKQEVNDWIKEKLA